jgi:glycosyltransferase involved in cell wall biosynthesis
MLFNILRKLNYKEPGLLIVGHDLKFLTPVIDHLKEKQDFRVDQFTYPAHVIRDKKSLLKILPRYDVVFCEWGLGNVSYISKHKPRGQKLVVRIHLQEFSTDFLNETNWDQVDAMIFISEFQHERFMQLFPEHAHKSRLIYNVIDCNDLDRPKAEDARFTLGMMGVLPMRKWPHLGVEILNELKKKDERFRLSIKSKRPEELDWLWRRPEEREYYDKLYAMIESMGLKDSVIFEPHGNDVPDWFRKIGFILSPSEFEGSHQSVAEGMAAGSVPVIRNWDGAAPLYPSKYVFNEVREAVEIILRHLAQESFQHESDQVRRYAMENFDKSVILPKYDQLLLSLVK